MPTTTFLSNAYITIGGVDFSDQCTSVTLTDGNESLEITAMGATGHVFAAGLQSNEVTAELFISYGAGEVEATLASLVGAGTTTVVIKPQAGTTTTSNPQYTISNMMLANFTPINSTVGEMATTTVSLSGGTLVRATV